MRTPSLAPYSGTREFADLDGVGMTLEAKAAQALAGILVGQVETPLQVLGGRLLHVQLLCVLLIEEANFLPERGRQSVKIIPPPSDSLFPNSQSQLTSRWFFRISPRV